MSQQHASEKSTTSALVVVGATLFAASAVWSIRKLRQERMDGESTHFGTNRRSRHHERFSIVYTDRESGNVGTRGQKALTPPIPYLKQFLVCLSNECHPIDNPQGHIPLCVAENKIVLDMLEARCMETGARAFTDSSVYCYQSFLGMPMAREAAAYFLARRFLFPDNPDLAPDQATQHISPKHVALGAGGAAMLSHLFYLLGEAGNACLIPRPYYAAFENDMNLLAGIVPVGVAQANAVVGPTEVELDLAYLQAKSKGMIPKFVLLTNPNNPLGTIYKPDIIRRTIQWARKRGMHTIVDEIYALSVHKKFGHDFESVIRVLNNDLGNDVHMVWATSKDFGASGLRVGLVYSQNEIFMEGLATLNIFSCISGPIQYLVSELFTDDHFVDTFLDEARNRLLMSYHICISKLEEMVLPYVQAEAGMFVYVDFSSLLPEKTFQWEEKLCDLMFEYARVVLTPGESQRETTPGMFRICYAWVSPEVLVIAMERLSRLVARIRRLDWADLNARAFEGVLL